MVGSSGRVICGRAKAFGIGTRYEVGVVGSSRNDQGHCGLQLVDRADVSQAPGVRFVWESQGLSPSDRYRLRLHGQILRRNDWDAEQLEDWGLDIPIFDINNAEEDQGNFDDPGIQDKNQYGVIVICESAGTQESVFSDLTNMGFNCKIVVT